MHRNAESLCKILKNRPHVFGAEVGVFQGDTSWRVLSILKNLKMLFCVDVWEENQDFLDASPNKSGRIVTADWTVVKNTFKESVIEAYPFRVCGMQMTSVEASRLIADESLDWVFIDANHSFEYTKQDIDLWTPKVKNGGIISGDDFVSKPLYGVKKAVKESFKTYNLIGKVWYTEKQK